MEKNTLIEIDERYYYKETDNWKCELEGQEVKLGLVIEVLDLRDIDSDVKDSDPYPYTIQAGIIPQNPSESYWEGDEDYNENLRLSLIRDFISYCGSVAYISEPEDLKDRFTLKEATLASYEDRFTGSTKQYLRFSEDGLEKALELYTEAVEVNFSTIGFVLDRAVNLVGDTGWSELEKSLNK